MRTQQLRGLVRSTVGGAVVCAVVFLGCMGLPIAAGEGIHTQHKGHNQQEGPIPHAHAHERTTLEIFMRDGVYHVQNDGRLGFTLNAGEETTLILRNEDNVAHEFITPLFTRTEVQFSGNAVGLFGKEAAGFRLDPGKTLLLRFNPPHSEPFKTMYDVVWCNLHKKGDGEARDGELLLVATNEVS